MDKKQFIFIYWNVNPVTLERFRDVSLIFDYDLSKAFLNKGFHHDDLICLAIPDKKYFSFFKFHFIHNNRTLSGFNLEEIKNNSIATGIYTTLIFSKL